MNEVCSDSRPRGPERVSNGDGPSIHIGLCRVQAQSFSHGQILRSKRFIDLTDTWNRCMKLWIKPARPPQETSPPKCMNSVKRNNRNPEYVIIIYLHQVHVFEWKTSLLQSFCDGWYRPCRIYKTLWMIWCIVLLHLVGKVCWWTEPSPMPMMLGSQPEVW